MISFLPAKTEVDECKRGCRFYDRIIESSEKASQEANARHHCNSCNISLTESFDFHNNPVSFCLKPAG